MVIQCPIGADPDNCGFPEPITVTVGPSTFRAEESFETLTAVVDCKVTGTTAALCEETYVGPADLIETDTDFLTATDASLNTQITTSAVTTALSQSDIAFIPVTITALAKSSASAGAGASESASTAPTTASGTQTTDSTSGTSGSSTSTGGSASPSNDSNNRASRGSSGMLALTAVSVWLTGLAIFIL